MKSRSQIKEAPEPRRRVVTRAEELAELSAEEREMAEAVGREFAFRANDYYLQLIDWADPADPIRQLVIPRAEELLDWGEIDASKESAVTVERGVQHKYSDTALLLCSPVCSAYCRYCFRKRLFMADNTEVNSDVSTGLRYIAGHPEISHVLLTGGDPLTLSTRRIKEILQALREIPHVKTVRIGSKVPAFDPERILGDPELLDTLSEHSTPDQRIYLMVHFDHPRELTDLAVHAIDALLRSGVICANQNPILAGVNDDSDTLAALFQKLSRIGCPPYYLFQGRPTQGNAAFAVPIVRGWQILQGALAQCSGLEARARFVMSHETGKIEILHVGGDTITLRYHRAMDPAQRGRVMVCKRDDAAGWFDDLQVYDPE